MFGIGVVLLLMRLGLTLSCFIKFNKHKINYKHVHIQVTENIIHT